MPHDKNGTLIEIGDIVTVECKVISVAMGETHCNLTVQTVIPFYKGEAGPGISSIPPEYNTVTLNTKQVVKNET